MKYNFTLDQITNTTNNTKYISISQCQELNKDLINQIKELQYILFFIIFLFGIFYFKKEIKIFLKNIRKKF